MKQQVRIYFLDDEPALCEVFKEVLGDEFWVKTFSDPFEFLKACFVEMPDFAFLDLRLPGMSGDQVACNLPGEVTKILVTGELRRKTIAQYYKVLEKPVEDHVYPEIIREVLGLKSS